MFVFMFYNKMFYFGMTIAVNRFLKLTVIPFPIHITSVQFHSLSENKPWISLKATGVQLFFLRMEFTRFQGWRKQVKRSTIRCDWLDSWTKDRNSHTHHVAWTAKPCASAALVNIWRRHVHSSPAVLCGWRLVFLKLKKTWRDCLMDIPGFDYLTFILDMSTGVFVCWSYDNQRLITGSCKRLISLVWDAVLCLPLWWNNWIAE